MINREYALKQMILFWSSKLTEAVQNDDMASALDIYQNTLSKCFDLYKQEVNND